jgi:hypothetical protein
MLKQMRHNAKYFYVLFFFIILSFVFWGVGRVDKGQNAGFVAEVGSDKITDQDFWRTYENMERYYRDIYKDKFDEAMQKKLKANVLDTLVDNQVLLDAAQKQGIVVSDAELDEAIRHEPAFMRNGAFDSQVYENRLRNMRLTPKTFESVRRRELIVEKMRRMIETVAYIPAEELNKLSGDDQTVKSLRQAMVENAKNQAVKAYVEGLKKQMSIKIYPERIS